MLFLTVFKIYAFESELLINLLSNLYIDLMLDMKTLRYAYQSEHAVNCFDMLSAIHIYIAISIELYID